MGFWVFMLVASLLIPLTMIGFGHYFMKSGPKKVNYIFGYRTVMSMKNNETWEFAHRYCGKRWFVTGWFILLPTLAGMLFVMGKDANEVGTFGGLMTGIQVLFLLGPIVSTEIALRKKFDKQGQEIE